MTVSSAIFSNIPPDILLFRHAATDLGDGPRRYIGRTEVALSRDGRAQAAAWRAHLAALNVVGAYASPLERARDTARLMLGLDDAPISPDKPHGPGKPNGPCARGASGVPGGLGESGGLGVAGCAAIPLTILDDLAEMDLGEWEGLVQMQVREDRPAAYDRRGREPWTFRPPGGECCADVAARGLRALAAMWRDWVETRGKAGTMPSATGAACVEGASRAAGRHLALDGSAGHGHGHVPFIVAVSHAGLIRSVLCALGHVGREELLALPLRHLHCVRLRRHESDGGGTLASTSAAPAASITSPTAAPPAASGTSAAWTVVSPDWQP
ncbi:histidine phosphatase family protein [Nitratidesulfovibrio liaohensis]|uniref:histidine phosphatase family protein n=1 Tax=Nitratidesulfovibrio liaohensis TaxID=2604158 RepID=UPI00141FE8D4|nr:histidine phosphatase family protein [Nitratidesulfovibrio liaohensis]NHZ46453.1 histidine phosphatase family protein [Nitratidesulfovibrio liaohensis]